MLSCGEHPFSDLNDFVINLGGVAMSTQEAASGIKCVQHFVSSPQFTQRNFFSENGLAMIRDAISSVGNVTSVSNYFPWKVICGSSSRSVIADLNKANQTVLSPNKKTGRAKERQFSCECVASSEGSEVEGSEVGARVRI